MDRIGKSLVVALAFAGLSAGCATYDYGYSQPYYSQPYAYGYDSGPGYYGPGYYVGPPALGFYYYDRDRHWDGDRGHHGHSRGEGRWHDAGRHDGDPGDHWRGDSGGAHRG